MFKNLFSFNGRIRRTEFGISFIIYIVFYCVIRYVMLANKESDNPSQVALLIVILFFIPLVWFLWSQGAKRCHDVGNSGWYQLIPFYVFWLLFQEGHRGPNEYGPDPKNPLEEFEYRDPFESYEDPQMSEKNLE